MSIKRRKYKDYESYLNHQSLKLKIGVKKKIKKFMPESFLDNVRRFEKRINGFNLYIKPGKVLCIGARTGAEVMAFRNLGFKDSIGIDINPGKDNQYVIQGDFHNMEFEDNTFDTIYCNCIDHAWDLRQLSKEIFRVLKKNSILILEIDHLLKKGKNERNELLKKNSKYESIMWGNFKDIEKGFKEFKLITKFTSVYHILLVAVFERS